MLKCSICQTFVSEAAKEEYKRQAERNVLELTNKTKELVEKIQELDVLKAKYEDSISNYSNMNSQVNLLSYLNSNIT